jgi:hypothetical protein
MSITIEVTGVDDICKRLSVDLVKVVRPAVIRIGEEIKTKLQTEPGPAHSPVIWASETQKRWWFAHRREKGLPFKYARGSDPETQDILHSWHVEPTPTGAVIGTRALAAPWVQSAKATPFGGPQTEQHKATGWNTDESVTREVVTEQIVQQAIGKAIMAALGGK